MPDYAQGRIPVRPFVQILLIAHSPFLQAIEAPFDALLPPALQAGHPLLVAAETDPFHVEAAVYRIALQPRDEAMLDDRDGSLSDLLEQRLPPREEHPIPITLIQFLNF